MSQSFGVLTALLLAAAPAAPTSAPVTSAGTASAPARAAAEGPVAVMPFKNLNRDPSLEWLRLGIAETVLADLRRSGVTRIVERDQLDRALAELALQGAGGSEEATAVKVGKLLGARTILLGSFQKVGKQIRLVARFVSVETGVVLEAVKVTGPLTRVLALQDEIVGRLLGEEGRAKAAPARPKRRETPKAVEAYRLYAMSLATASDADRIGYLRQSLEEDPGFTYATEELLALEQRMKGYARESARQAELKSRADAEALFGGAATPEQRSQQAVALLGQHLQRYRYRALLRDAQRIRGLGLPPIGNMDVKEYAAWCEFEAYQRLKLIDQALKAGEQHLAAFPAGMYASAVQMGMRVAINQRLEEQRGEGEAARELAALEKEREELARGGGAVPHVRALSLDFKACSILAGHKQHRRAVGECLGFAEKVSGDPDATAQQFRSTALFLALNAQDALGDFGQARRTAERLVEEYPDFARQAWIPGRMEQWTEE